MMLTTTQAAEKLGVCSETIRRLVKDGSLKAVALSKPPRARIRINGTDLQAFIDKNTRGQA